MFDDTGNAIRCDNYDINQCFEPTSDDMKFFRVIDYEVILLKNFFLSIYTYIINKQTI